MIPPHIPGINFLSRHAQVLWFAAIGVFAVIFCVHLDHYLQSIANAIPMWAAILLGIFFRVRYIYKCQYGNELGKALGLLMAVVAGAALLAPLLRDGLTFAIHEVATKATQDPDMYWFKEYLDAMGNKIVGYVGCYFAAILLIDTVRSWIGKRVGLFRYPRSKYEKESAFHSAACAALPSPTYQRLVDIAKHELASTTTYYEGNNPKF